MLALGLLVGNAGMRADVDRCQGTSASCAAEVAGSSEVASHEDPAHVEEASPCDLRACAAHGPEHAHGHGASPPPRADAPPPGSMAATRDPVADDHPIDFAVAALPAMRVAVERNLEVVPRSKLGDVKIEDGDDFEIVRFVGGG